MKETQKQKKVMLQREGVKTFACVCVCVQMLVYIYLCGPHFYHVTVGTSCFEEY